MCTHGKLVIVIFKGTVLRGAVGSRGFNSVVERPKNEILELEQARKFTILVGTNAATLLMAMEVKKFTDNVQRWIFGGRQKHPDVSSHFIHNQEE